MPFGGLSLTAGISDNCPIVRVADQRGRGEIFPRTTRMPVYSTILGDSLRLRVFVVELNAAFTTKTRRIAKRFPSTLEGCSRGKPPQGMTAPQLAKV